MKKTDTWMPLYVADYMADTARLTTEQHGAYLLLIIDYWRNGPPPDEDSVLARVTGLSPSGWKKQRSIIAKYFRISGGEWRHKRIDDELIKARDNADRRSAKAKIAAQIRWSENAASNAPSIPQALPKECPPPSPSSVSSSEETTIGVSFHPRYQEVIGKVETLLASPNLHVFGRVDAWLKSGADPDEDIYPTLTRLKPNWSGSSLNYFDKAIADAMKARTSPLPEGSAPSYKSRFGSNGTATYEPRPVDAEENQWRARLNGYKPGGYWPDVWGGRPGEPGCTAPAAILREFNL